MSIKSMIKKAKVYADVAKGAADRFSADGSKLSAFTDSVHDLKSAKTGLALGEEIYLEVAGEYYYKSAIRSIMERNPMYGTAAADLPKSYYGKNIYEFFPYDGALLLEGEPSNRYNPRALKVVTSGQHIGYIADSDLNLAYAILSSRAYLASIKITGGPYKVVLKDVAGDPYVTHDSYNFRAVIHFILDRR